ncbi:F0F1 ATP synthase subunit B' domain protein [Oesophagostomum dentatum]|uniref:F0F1 ATP synthase subunit B' domain protein n=1 Tax=Oesophagostomum dentatum TaxID=61180 RepID=A0A0B1T1I9_OESDE|nr:F0F1 ATP synthase subunit B' domain protein [Oesophagostomum dentatum]
MAYIDGSSQDKLFTSAELMSSDTAKNSKEEEQELLSDASSLHAQMLKFSEDLNALIMRRKEADAECSRLAGS